MVSKVRDFIPIAMIQNRKQIIPAIVIGSIALLLPCLLNAQSLERKIYSSGGDQALIGLNAYAYTFGEPIIGTDQSNLPSLTMGFHQPMPQSLLAVHELHARVRWESDASLLNWETDAFVEGSYFLLERSVDGNAFLSIEEIHAQAISANVYTFRDQQAARLSARTLYYRISWVGNHGALIGSELLEVRVPVQGSSYVELFPNPASISANLRIVQASPSPTNLLMLNSLGAIVWKNRIETPDPEQAYQIPIAQLASGTYILRIHTATEQQTLRLIIAH